MWGEDDEEGREDSELGVQGGVGVIEATSVTIDGETRLGSLRVLEPDRKWHGVGVHLVQVKLIRTSDIDKRLRVLGLRQIYYDMSCRCFYYAQTLPAVIATIVEFFASRYWKAIWWLYAHGRLFQELPISAGFSWRYFTPFYVCLKVIKWFKRQR